MMNRTIIVGIASFGMSGKIFHAPLLTANKNFKIKRIVERTKNEAQTLYPAVIISRSFEELLHDNEIELIVVNTPDQTHFDYAKKSLEAGKHVVVEKPFTQTVEQGEELINLAKKNRKLLSVFHNRRWDGDFLTVQRIVKKQMLGRLVDYEAHFDRYRNFIQTDSWKEQPAAGTDVVYNLGAHMIDQALVLFGMPTAVTAHLKIMRTGGAVNDWYDIRLHYPNVNVNLKTSLLVREQGPRYILHGTHGSFLKWGIDPQEEALKLGKNPNDPSWGKESKKWWGLLHIEKDTVQVREKYETLPGNYSSFYNNIFESIAHQKALAVKPEEALDVIRIITSAQKSSAQQKTIMMVS